MEKIKEALAKAKLQKPSEKKESNSPKINAQKHFTHLEHQLDAINYSNSSVLRLDQAHLEKNLIVTTNHKGDVNSAVFDSLRTQVLQKMEENNWRTLAVVSPTPESGKTVISINLAISIAHLPQRTAVLVDFDLRRPRVATYLGMHVQKSMNEYLLGQARVEEVMFNPGIPRLVVMPTMRPVSKSAEVLSSSKVTTLIQELRDRYESRIVIFDLPPVLNADDAMMVLPQVDCILMVVANGMSKQSEIEETLHHLPKEKLLGVVLNKAEIEAKQYYY
jgi:protein-tyrosine kinase